MDTNENVIVATICIVTRNVIREGVLCKEILLGERTKNPCKGYWVSYGGRLEKGKETLVQCAKRELREESTIEANFIVKCAHIRFHDKTSTGEEKIVDGHIYLAQDWSGEPKQVDESIINPQWFPITALPKVPLADTEWLSRVLSEPGELIEGEVWYKKGTFSEYERPAIWRNVSAFPQ